MFPYHTAICQTAHPSHVRLPRWLNTVIHRNSLGTFRAALRPLFRFQTLPPTPPLKKSPEQWRRPSVTFDQCIRHRITPQMRVASSHTLTSGTPAPTTSTRPQPLLQSFLWRGWREQGAQMDGWSSEEGNTRAVGMRGMSEQMDGGGQIINTTMIWRVAEVDRQTLVKESDLKQSAYVICVRHDGDATET